MNLFGKVIIHKIHKIKFSLEHPQSTTTLLFSFRHNKNFYRTVNLKVYIRKNFHFIYCTFEMIKWRFFNIKCFLWFQGKEGKILFDFYVCVSVIDKRKVWSSYFFSFITFLGNLLPMDLIRKRPGLSLEYYEINTHELCLVHFDKSIYYRTFKNLASSFNFLHILNKFCA
jgi:hypothetical protein